MTGRRDRQKEDIPFKDMDWSIGKSSILMMQRPHLGVKSTREHVRTSYPSHDVSCMSHFLCNCDKITYKRNLRKEGFQLHSFGSVEPHMSQKAYCHKCKTVNHIASVYRAENNGPSCSTQFFLSIQSKTPVSQMILPTFKVNHCTSQNGPEVCVLSLD